MNTRNIVTENNFEALATLVPDLISTFAGERTTDSEPPVGTAHMPTFDLWTKEAETKMQNGDLPDLRPALLEIYRTFTRTQQPYSARQFIPILERLKLLNHKELAKLTALSGRSIVLAKNDLIKASLIHWTPAKPVAFTVIQLADVLSGSYTVELWKKGLVPMAESISWTWEFANPIK